MTEWDLPRGGLDASLVKEGLEVLKLEVGGIKEEGCTGVVEADTGLDDPGRLGSKKQQNIFSK